MEDKNLINKLITGPTTFMWMFNHYSSFINPLQNKTKKKKKKHDSGCEIICSVFVFVFGIVKSRQAESILSFTTRSLFVLLLFFQAFQLV